VRRLACAALVLVGCGATTPPPRPARPATGAPTAVSRAETPPPVAPLPDVEKVRADLGGVCALARRRFACATKDDPILRSLATDVVDFDISDRHRCVVLATGRVRCAGSNARGELGAGLSVGSVAHDVEAKGVTNAVRVALAEGLSCALTSDGGVFCWGDNAMGQTGGPNHYVPELREWVVPTRVPLPGPMRGVAVTPSRACAYDDARVFCWGIGRPPQQVQVSPPEVVHGVRERLFATAKNGDVFALDDRPVIAQRPLELLRGAVELSEDRGPLCGVTRARNVVCDGDRRRYEDDPRRGPFVQALEPIAAKSSLTQRFGLVFVLAADGTVFVSGASAYMGELGRLPTRSDVPVPLGNVATAPPP